MLMRILCASIFCAGICLAQAQSSSPSDAFTLLQQTGQRYASAKSYDIEVVQERTSSAELRRDWQKSFFTAIEAEGHRYRYSSRSATGNSAVVSDGKIEWLYHADEDAYIQKTASADGPAPPADLSMREFELFKVAVKLRETLAGLPDRYKSAETLPDETLELGGRQVLCRVVRVRGQDLKKPMRPGSTSEKTIWIAKENGAVRKIVTHTHGPSPMAPSSIEDSDTTELYTAAELDSPVTDNTFIFAPPITAKLVKSFANSFLSPEEMTGKAAPAFVLKSPDGKDVSLASLRGKNVLLDFWATWCLPCVASMPQMADLYQQTKDKGLVFISIDKDEDAKTAADFLSKRHEPWPNFHDTGEVSKAFKEAGIPLTVLINAEGAIVYYKSGYGDSSLSDLRAAIAKLGPEYSSVTQPGTAH